MQQDLSKPLLDWKGEQKQIMYQKDSIAGIILVDASNSFNYMNWQTALHNIQYICPPLATKLINTYRNLHDYLSQEGIKFYQEKALSKEIILQSLFTV